MMKFILTLILFSGTAFADRSTVTPVEEKRIGNIRYYVSDSNRLIHVILPFQVSIGLNHLDGGTGDETNLVTVYGDFKNTDSIRSVLSKIRDRYPGYQFTGQSNEVAVVECSFRLPSGRESVCQVPPGTGSYFSVTDMISDEDAAVLKREFSKGAYAGLKVTFRHLVPQVSESEVVSLPVGKFIRNLGGEFKEATLGQVVKEIHVMADATRINPDSSIYEDWIQSMMSESFSEGFEIAPGFHSFQELLSIKLKTRKPGFETRLLKKEDNAKNPIFIRFVAVVRVWRSK